MRPLLLVSAACITGLVAGLAWPPPPIPREQLLQQDTWSLPDPSSIVRMSEDTFQTARKGLRWTGETEPTEAGELAGPWRLLGLVEGPDMGALVTTGGEVKRLTRGDAMPDGRRLAAVYRDRITVEDSGCNETFKLYHPQPVERSGTCPDQPSE